MHVFATAVLAFFLALSPEARSQEGSGTPPEDAPDWSDSESAADEEMPEELTPVQRLEAGIRLYQTGEATTAQAELAILVNDTSYSDIDLRQRARIFLGEVLYVNKHEEEARHVFERVLTVDPTYVIDPFEHLPDVCGFFETIRVYIRPEGTANPTATGPLPPVPVVGYLGFGVYQMRYGRTNVGTIMLVSQTAFGALSVAGAASLLENHTYEADNEADMGRMVRRRNTQWISTALFYGIWTWGIFDAGQHWRANVVLDPPQAKPGRQGRNGPPGMELRIDGRFGR